MYKHGQIELPVFTRRIYYVFRVHLTRIRRQRIIRIVKQLEQNEKQGDPNNHGISRNIACVGSCLTLEKYGRQI